MSTHVDRRFRLWQLAAFGLVAAAPLAGCSSSTGQSDTGGSGGAGDNGFLSDDPNAGSTKGGDSNGSADAGAGSATGGSGGGAGAGGSTADPGDEASPERIIEEADIIQVKDNRLYALSYYSGLAVIDVSTQDQLSLLGRYRTDAQPFEMIVRDNVVIAEFSSYPIWAYDEASGGWTAQQTSRVVALDTTNPADIREIGTYDIPGEISDSRVVGNIFYVVAYENGYCWDCDVNPNTTVISLDVSNPQAIRLVDKLSFQDQQNSYGWYKRSITVNTERMYVSGQNWDWNTGTGNSTVEVVDISDPNGDLVKGASVPVKGEIESRWQMDEYEGVLRVISQPGNGWSSISMPVVETFQVASAQQLTPLGELQMDLPAPENLQSVRFDGTRAFAVTFQQTDPLFTLDLSDPAHPQQVGELQMPGYLYYMAPRGDRMLALGYDQSNSSGSITVSLFDISDLAHPTMLQRVNFGGDWGWLPEDQDRIHKAFNILDDQGLILVPYSGWDYNDTTYYCGRYTSGIQLIDFANDTLTLRGAAPQRGNARRAFIHNDRLFAVSDEGVNTFDIANRDAPLGKASLNLAHNAVKSIAVGNKLVQISGDWWTDQAELSVFPLNDPERDQALGTLNLRALADGSQYPDTCYSYYGFVYGSTMFAHDHYVWLVWDDTYWGYYDYNNPTGRTSVAVIDVADAAHPVLVSRTDFNFRFDGWYWYDYYGYYGYYGYGAMLSAGKKAVQYGSTLVLQEFQQGSWDYNTNQYIEPGPPNLRVIDLSDPAHPAMAATLPESSGYGYSALQLDGATVFTSHYEDVPGSGGKVRFYVDRWNIANPYSPVQLGSINVPGSLVSVDQASNRLLTVDYERIVNPATSYDECYAKWGYGGAYFDYDNNECVGIRRYLRLLDVQGSHASIMDSLQLEDGWYSNPSVGSDRIFLVRYASYYYTADGYVGDPDNHLLAISGFQSGHLTQSPAVALKDQYWSWNSVFAHGTKAIAVGWYPGSIAVYDTANATAAPQLVKSEELYGYPNDLTVVGDTAICSLGYWGVQAVPLSP